MQDTTTTEPRAARRSFAVWLAWLIGGALVLGALYVWFMLWWSYSDGERAGVLQKFSKRGWICKTYEGELAMYVVGGVAPQIWNFSARDETTADELRRAVGRQVRLHYTEHPGLPTNCFGETDYFVDGVEIVGPPPVPVEGSVGSSPVRPDGSVAQDPTDPSTGTVNESPRP